MDSRVLFIGGDKRIIYAARAVSRRFEVHTLGLYSGEPLPIGKYGAVVLPLPFSRSGEYINAPLSGEPLPLSLAAEYAERGGLILSGMGSPALTELCKAHGLILYDYFADEVLTLKNAALTAEAAVSILIQSTEYSLCGAGVLVTGGGRISQLTARLLRAFGADVTVCARSASQRAKAELEFHRAAELRELERLCKSADIIVNTAPAHLFGAEEFARMREGTVFMELASLPAKPYEDFAAESGVKYIHASGLPGKFSPKAAGEAIGEAVLAFLVGR